jgi:hypothetical protein
MNLKYHIRKTFNAAVALVPRQILSGFLRSFEQHPELAEAAGYQIFPRRFYAPLPLLEEIDWKALEKRRHWLKIDFRETEANELLPVLGKYSAEMDSIPYERPDDNSPFWFNNFSFTDFDAAALYGMLRHYKPKKYIELGCGFSSYISSLALSKNIAEGSLCEAIYVDPAPRRDMEKTLFTGKLICERVQRLPLEMFRQLEAGDVLFIDTSHVVKVQSDVVRELLEIIPALQAGVIIHIHDMFSPYDYPTEWVQNKIRLSCNEQYGVECLLTGGQLCQVLLPLYLLWREQRQELQKLFPRGKDRPHSFWIMKTR